MIRAMCEQFVARSAEPFRLDTLWELADALEHFGMGGFGWGAAWTDADGGLHSYRDIRSFRDDPGKEALGATETRSLLVHLRRPSRLSTLQLADTQPFDDPAGRYIFSHNGDLKEYQAYRRRYQRQGRILGRADTEVGARWLEDEWSDEEPVGHLLASLHDAFGGEANFAVLARDGTPYHYAGNPQNLVFAFRLGQIGVVSTSLYSIDRSIFRFAAKGATHRQLARLHTTIALDERGDAQDTGHHRSHGAAGGR